MTFQAGSMERTVSTGVKTPLSGAIAPNITMGRAKAAGERAAAGPEYRKLAEGKAGIEGNTLARHWPGASLILSNTRGSAEAAHVTRPPP